MSNWTCTRGDHRRTSKSSYAAFNPEYKWSYNTWEHDFISVPPVVSTSGFIYVVRTPGGSGFATINRIDPTDGSVIWTNSTDGYYQVMQAALMTLPDDALVVLTSQSSSNSVLICLEPTNGTLRWSFTLGVLGFGGYPCLLDSGNICLLRKSGGTHFVTVLDSTGATVSDNALSANVIGTPKALSTDGTYV